MSEPEGKQDGGASLAGRVLVTVIAALAFASLQLIPLPGVELNEAVLGDTRPQMSTLTVGCLGSAPITSAFVTVEIAALCVPRWRKLRNRDPLGRAKLQRAATIYALVLAAFQAWGMAMFLGGGDVVLLDVSQGFLTLTITAAVAVSLVLARWVDARGLGVGLSVIIASDVLASIVFHAIDIHPATRQTYILANVGAAIAAAAIFTFNQAISTGLRKLTPMPKRSDSAPEQIEPVRWPLCGVYPVILTIAIARFPTTLATFGVSGADTLQRALLWPGTTLSLIALFAFIFSRLFHPRARLLDLAHALGIGKRYEARLHTSLRPALLLSVALVLMLGAVTLWLAEQQVFYGVVVPFTVIAILIDLTQEWKFRSKAGPVAVVQQSNHVYEADLYADVLRQGGIKVHIQGISYRSLLHFFAPFTQLSLMVPEEQREKAEEIVRGGVGA